MRKIRRKNPNVRDVNGADALDDVNEQELAKDGGIERLFTCAQENIEINKDPVSEVDERDDTQRAQSENATDSAPLPTSVDKKEESLVVSRRSKRQEKREQDAQTPPCGTLKDKEKGSAKKRNTNVYYIAFIAVCMLLSVLFVLGAAFDRPNEQTDDADDGLVVEKVPSDKNEEPKTQTSLYEKISATAVTVRARGETGVKVGSGTVVFSDGYIATLWDTVDGAKSVEVTLKSGERYSATLVGGSALTELALLKISADGLECASLGNGGVRIGDAAYAVGAIGATASASLSSSLCTGSISYAERSLRVDDGKTQKFISVIQLEGFSSDTLGGCPVFNGDGEMIGITVNVGADAARFALPAGEAMELLSAIKSGATPSDEVVSAIAYPCPSLGAECGNVENGVKIEYLSPSSDAARKLREGDVIVKIGADSITDTERLREVIEKHRVGDTVEIFVQRYRQMLSFYVDLSE